MKNVKTVKNKKTSYIAKIIAPALAVTLVFILTACGDERIPDEDAAEVVSTEEAVTKETEKPSQTASPSPAAPIVTAAATKETQAPANTPTQTPTQSPIKTPAPTITQTPTPTVAPTPIPTEAPTPEPTPEPVAEVPSVSAAGDVSAVVDIVNSERANNGLGAVSMTSELNAAAQKRAEEITSTFSHDRPDGSSCFTILPEYGIGYMACGENIAAGQRSAESVMNAWMNSPGHRSNILSGSFNHIGVGCVYVNDSYGYYWVQLFTD